MATILNYSTLSWRRVTQGFSPSLFIAFLWIAAMGVIALLANHLTPFDIAAMDLRERLRPPAFLAGGDWIHPLGTDQLGRDTFSRLLSSIRTSMTIGLISTFIAAAIGVGLGFLAAHGRGRVEQIILMLIDAQAAIPFMIVALAVLAFFGNNLVLFTVLLGFYGWERIARLSRGLAMSASEQGYTIAVRDIGASPVRLYALHILPNVGSSLIVAMTLNLPEVILLETSLSFLGLGVQPPLSSLGNMVGSARAYMEGAPWLVFIPSAVIMLTALSVSIIGDWLRDRADPMSDSAR
ncbi:ABC transporter permease [Paraburkholderia aspalathi]|uniref:Peptide/nickel transport system permease protein n=1 Tax=Paraburkholderia aspalathi TaxID=1324617 RepID=A0A1I7B904_9BURK|nr:ABC transporter permease [Paraburkholderia aspalathi]SFT83680.1 peptide/nickel transport system permease protein [Paraburkholderia aspalathi]